MTVTSDPLSVDAILQGLGTFGRYQKFQTFLLLLGNLTIAFHLLNIVFIAQDIQHTCSSTNRTHVKADVDGNHNYGECSITTRAPDNKTTVTSCDTWIYDKEKEHSVVSQWDLVCGNTAFARLPQTLFIVGQGVGALVFSTLSDRFGRRPFLLLSHTVTAVIGVALAFSPNIVVFSIIRFLNGAFQQGIVITTATLILELFPRQYRIEVATLHAVIWSCCPTLMTLVAYLLRYITWKSLQLVFSSVSILVILQLLFVDESLRWLMTNRKIQRSVSVLKKAAAINRVNADELSSLCMKSMTSPHDTGDDVKDAKTYSILDIFRTRFMLRVSIIVWFSWLIDSLTYFGLYLSTSSLADDLYLNFFLNSLAEIPTGPLFWFVGRRWGRRRFFMVFHIMAGVCLLLATIIRSLAVGVAASTSATVFAFVGKVGNAACFSSMFVYVPEIYPTNLRTVGVGAGSTAARVGAAVAPFLSMLADEVFWAPGTIFGVGCLIISVLVLMQPEPEGRELPRTIEEIQQWPRDIGRGTEQPKDE